MSVFLYRCHFRIDEHSMLFKIQGRLVLKTFLMKIDFSSLYRAAIKDKQIKTLFLKRNDIRNAPGDQICLFVF